MAVTHCRTPLRLPPCCPAPLRYLFRRHSSFAQTEPTDKDSTGPNACSGKNGCRRWWGVALLGRVPLDVEFGDGASPRYSVGVV
jgi:hypothetical protein